MYIYENLCSLTAITSLNSITWVLLLIDADRKLSAVETQFWYVLYMNVSLKGLIRVWKMVSAGTVQA